MHLRVGISRAQNGRVPRVWILRVVWILGLWILGWVDCNSLFVPLKTHEFDHEFEVYSDLEIVVPGPG